MFLYVFLRVCVWKNHKFGIYTLSKHSHNQETDLDQIDGFFTNQIRKRLRHRSIFTGIPCMYGVWRLAPKRTSSAPVLGLKIGVCSRFGLDTAVIFSKTRTFNRKFFTLSAKLLHWTDYINPSKIALARWCARAPGTVLQARQPNSAYAGSGGSMGRLWTPRRRKWSRSSTCRPRFRCRRRLRRSCLLQVWQHTRLARSRAS